MRRTSSRQIRRDLVLENDLYTSAKAFEFPVVSIAGANVADSLATNASAIVTEKNRLDTLIDSGSTLDTISELKSAWEGGDSSLSTAVDALVATATADRAAIRTEVGTLKPVRIFYVDAGRSDSYTETGSFQSPFKSLVTAMGRGSGTPQLLEDSSTDHVIFKLAPGDYTGVSITKATQNQTVEIHGSGSAVTNIQASAAWDATAGNVLFLQRFTAIRIKDCAVRYGAYGCYLRDVSSVELSNCRFYNLGSSGSYHGFDVSKADQATYWAARGTAGAHRSDGGAMRLRTVSEIAISDCTAVNVLRGFRLQDISRGRVSDCSAISCCESGFYCAAGNYSGASGCTNMVISGCYVQDCLNNAYLVIGGSNVVITACSAQNVANSAVMAWHAQDLKVLGCTFNRATRLTYNGVGNDGDSFGALYCNGGTSITSTGGYMCTAIGNVFTRCGQGRADAIYTFFIGDLQDNTQSSWRLIIDGNNSDAAQDISNTESVPLVSTRYPAAAGPTVTASRAVVSDGSGALSASATTSAELAFVSGVTSALQTQLDSKGVAFNGTNNKAVVTDGSGDLATATVSSTELGYLAGVTSSLQDQLDAASGFSGTSNRLMATDGSGAASAYANMRVENSGNRLKMTGTQNQEIKIEHSVYAETLSLHSSYGGGGMKYAGCKIEMHKESNANGRIQLQADLIRMPRNASAPPQNSANASGGLYYNTTTDKLMAYIGTSWKELAVV